MKRARRLITSEQKIAFNNEEADIEDETFQYDNNFDEENVLLFRQGIFHIIERTLRSNVKKNINLHAQG